VLDDNDDGGRARCGSVSNLKVMRWSQQWPTMDRELRKRTSTGFLTRFSPTAREAGGPSSVSIRLGRSSKRRVEGSSLKNDREEERFLNWRFLRYPWTRHRASRAATVDGGSAEIVGFGAGSDCRRSRMEGTVAKSYEALMRSLGRAVFYRPERQHVREILFRDARPKLLINGDEYPIFDVSMNGLSFLTPRGPQLWPIGKSIDLSLLLHGEPVYQGSAHVARVEPGPCGARVGVGLLTGFLDLLAPGGVMSMRERNRSPGLSLDCRIPRRLDEPLPGPRSGGETGRKAARICRSGGRVRTWERILLPQREQDGGGTL
jgi:hypothetical protein